MLHIQGTEISAATGDMARYAPLKPLTNQAGLAWWVVDSAGQLFVDVDTEQTYFLRKRSPSEMDDLAEASFTTVQAELLASWNHQVNVFISTHFDTGTQISLLKIYIQNEAVRPLLEQVDAWVSATMSYYYAVKADIQSAATLADLTQLQPALEFDSRFGQQGSLLLVPSVQLSNFYGNGKP